MKAIGERRPQVIVPLDIAEAALVHIAGLRSDTRHYPSRLEEAISSAERALEALHPGMKVKRVPKLVDAPKQKGK